jgi:spermidine/putrescine transport system substrate-binding protein
MTALPEDPMIRQLVVQARRAQAARRQLSRRSVIAGAGGGALALFLAACSSGGGGAAAGPTAAADVSATKKSMTWANWSYYLDENKAGAHPTLEAFEKKTGIQVKYDVAVDDNNTYYAKVKDQLALGQDIGADTVCLTDWMVSRLITQKWVQAFDADAMPNATANLSSTLRSPDFDPKRSYSMPWQTGFAGIAWNKKKLPSGLSSVNDLWDPSLKGKIGVLSEMRDTMGLIMLSQGVDISSKGWGDDEFDKALAVFKKNVSDGQIRNIKGNSYADDLKNGDTLAAIVWSGDITSINAEVGSDDFGFAIPDEGGTIWSDNFVIPIGSSRKANAEKLIDYYYEPEVAAKVAAYVNYVTPVDGAKEAMKKVDPSLVDNQLIFPDTATLGKVKMFRTLTNAEQMTYNGQFEAVGLGS